jgi:release factor glutamine methyltransferase
MQFAKQDAPGFVPTPTIGEALHDGTELLQQAGVGVPRLTVEVLLASVLERDKSYLYAYPEEPLGQRQWEKFQRCLDERLSGKPTQYITGWQEFYGLQFHVTPQVFIPRPETEHVVEQVLALAGQGTRILDVGTGSGAIAISIQKNCPAARVYACDLSAAALEVADDNARRLQAQVQFVQSDLLEAFSAQCFDVVASNPPYVALSERAGLQREVREFEPAQALFAGEDGLDAYRRLSRDVGRVLRPGGWLVMELGYRARLAVEALLAGPPWEKPTICPDLAGWDRVVVARKRS